MNTSASNLKPKPFSAPASAAAGPSADRGTRAFDTAQGHRQQPPLAQAAPDPAPAAAGDEGGLSNSLSALAPSLHKQQQQQPRSDVFAGAGRLVGVQPPRGGVEGREESGFRTPPPREPPRTPPPAPRPAGLNPLLRPIPLGRLDGGRPERRPAAAAAAARTTDDITGASTDATMVGPGGLMDDDLQLPLTQDEDEDMDDAGGLGDDAGNDDHWGEDDVTLIFGGLGLADQGPLQEIVVDQEQERCVWQRLSCASCRDANAQATAGTQGRGSPRAA